MTNNTRDVEAAYPTRDSGAARESIGTKIDTSSVPFEDSSMTC